MPYYSTLITIDCFVSNAFVVVIEIETPIFKSAGQEFPE